MAFFVISAIIIINTANNIRPGFISPQQRRVRWRISCCVAADKSLINFFVFSLSSAVLIISPFVSQWNPPKHNTTRIKQTRRKPKTAARRPASNFTIMIVVACVFSARAGPATPSSGQCRYCTPHSVYARRWQSNMLSLFSFQFLILLLIIINNT